MLISYNENHKSIHKFEDKKTFKDLEAINSYNKGCVRALQ